MMDKTLCTSNLHRRIRLSSREIALASALSVTAASLVVASVKGRSEPGVPVPPIKKPAELR